MKAVAIKRFGSPEGLHVVEVPAPAPAAGEVLIAVEAAAVTGADLLIRSGALAAYGFQEGHILGSEPAGTVVEAGEGVDASWVGRRVGMFTGVGGGHAEQVTAPAGEILPLPEGLSSVDAAALGGSALVAHFGLRHARFASGESVLIRGAAGSIGSKAVQLAVRGGADAVAVTTSSPERGERLRELGATHVLDRSGEGDEGAPTGYDVIIDIVAGAEMPSFFDRLNPGGRMVAVGAVAGIPPTDFGATMMRSFQKSMSFATFSTSVVPPADLRAVAAEQFAAVVRGELRVPAPEVLPLEQAASAHRKMDAGEVVGRIVLTP